MGDIITRVAEVIERQMMKAGGFRYEGDPGSYHPAIEEISAAVIAEVRRFDVERGPSDAELTAFADAEIKARRWDYHDARTANRKGMEAAAKVRQEEAE